MSTNTATKVKKVDVEHYFDYSKYVLNDTGIFNIPDFVQVFHVLVTF